MSKKKPATLATAKRTPVGIKKTDEAFSKYTLEDGTELSIKQIVFEVFRLEGLYNQSGEPVYEIKGGPAMHVTVPKKLLRR